MATTMWSNNETTGFIHLRFVYLIGIILYLNVHTISAQCVFTADSIKIDSFLDRGNTSTYSEWHDLNALLPYAPYIWVEGIIKYVGQEPLKVYLEDCQPIFQAFLCFGYRGKDYQTQILFSDLIDEPIIHYPIQGNNNRYYLLTPNSKTKVTFGGVLLSEKEFSTIQDNKRLGSQKKYYRRMKKCGKRLSEICREMIIKNFIFDSDKSGLIIRDTI